MLERFPLIILTLCIIFLSSCCQTSTGRTITSQPATSPVIASVPPSSEFLARPPQKIAVIVLNLSYGYVPQREIEDVFIRALMSKGFRVTSRSDIEPILKEIILKKGPVLTDEDAAEFGKMLNVPAVMIVTITRGDGSINVMLGGDLPTSVQAVALGARLVSVELAENLWNGSTEQFYPRLANILIEVAKAAANRIPSYPSIR